MGNINYGTLAGRVTALGAVLTAGWGPPRPRRCSPTSVVRTWTPIALILSAAAGAPLLAVLLR
jgi:hypothetical protein